MFAIVGIDNQYRCWWLHEIQARPERCVWGQLTEDVLVWADLAAAHRSVRQLWPPPGLGSIKWAGVSQWPGIPAAPRVHGRAA